MPHPLCAGSNQWPVRSTSLIVPDWTNGSSVHVPCVFPICQDAVIFSKCFTVSRIAPTSSEREMRPPDHVCFWRIQTPPRLSREPCAVYQMGAPASLYVYQTTKTWSDALRISKPCPDF